MIPGFGSISKGGKTIVENRGLGDHHHSSLDLAEPDQKRNSPEAMKNYHSIKTIEDSIDQNVKQMLKGGKRRKYKKQ